MMLIFSLLISLLQGYLLISLLFPYHANNILLSLTKLFLTIGTGFGLSSCLFFIWILNFPSQNKGIIFLDLFFLFLLFVIFVVNKKRKKFYNSTKSINKSSQYFIDKLLLTILLFVLIIDIFIFVRHSIHYLHGDWDAWAIWNLHARFIFRNNDLFNVAYANIPFYSHPDYPLLIPLTIVRSWCYYGQESQLLVIIIHFLFTFCTIGLIVVSLSLIRSPGQGYLGGLVLLGTPLLIFHGASQCADVPLSYYFLATFVIINLKDIFFTKNNKLIFLVGLLAGFAAWTKNEGLLLLTVLIAARLIVYWKAIFNNLKESDFYYIIAGACPIVFIILLFKYKYVTINSTMIWEKLYYLYNFSLYMKIIKEFIYCSIDFSKTNINLDIIEVVIRLPIFLILYILLAGIDYKKEMTKIYLYNFTAILLIICGYISVYVIFPDRLGSLYRILLQIYPSFIMIAFLMVRTPGKLYFSARKDIRPKEQVKLG